VKPESRGGSRFPLNIEGGSLIFWVTRGSVLDLSNVDVESWLANVLKHHGCIYAILEGSGKVRSYLSSIQIDGVTIQYARTQSMKRLNEVKVNERMPFLTMTCADTTGSRMRFTVELWNGSIAGLKVSGYILAPNNGSDQDKPLRNG
jgi:hypothetical protein